MRLVTDAVTATCPLPAPASTLVVAEERLEAEVPYSNQYEVSRPVGLTLPLSDAVVEPIDDATLVVADCVVPLLLKSCNPPYVVPAEFDATTSTR